MDNIAKGIFIFIALFVVGFLAISYVKGFLGKPMRRKLKVPLGREIVAVQVVDGACLKPYKFSQAFEAETELEADGEVGLLFRGKLFGIADPSNDYSKVLAKLMGVNDKVVVQAMVLSMDGDGNPLVQIMLPDAGWFRRAIKPLYPKRG